MNQTDGIATLLAAVSQLPPGRALVAVSGGPDSVALLRALSESGRDIAVAHVNHGLRGDESDEDEQFVRGLGGRLGLPVFVRTLETGHPAARSENGARRLRYAALQSILDAWPGDFVVTGHMEEDQAETLLLHLMRGAGLGGLAAMDAHGTAPARPFLGIPRRTILLALTQWNQEYRVDSSNADRGFTRNRVRWDILPLMQQFNPDVAASLARAARLVGDDAHYLERESDRALVAMGARCSSSIADAPRSVLAALHPSLARAVARSMIQCVLGDVANIDEKHIAAILDAIRNGEKTSLQLPRGLTLEMDRTRATLRRGSTHAPVSSATEATLDVPGTMQTETGTLTVTRIEPASDHDLRRLLTVAGPFHAVCDADAVGKTLMVRSRRAGDRVKPAGSAVTRKLQDILVDARVPRRHRDAIPVVTNGSHIVWIPGLVVDRRTSVSAASTHILHLAWRANPSD